MPKQLFVVAGVSVIAVAAVAAIVYWLVGVRTGDIQIVKHRKTELGTPVEIVDVGKLRTITMPKTGKVGVQFSGHLEGDATAGLWQTGGDVLAEASDPNAADTPNPKPNYWFQAVGGKLEFVASTIAPVTVTLTDGSQHTVTKFVAGELERLDQHTVLVVESRSAAAPPSDPPKRRVWTVPNKRIDDWLNGTR